MEPLVSVILPVYNQESYIAETIESILAQTYQHFEILILDDGSTDQSAQVIREYEKKDARIKAYYEKNAGRSKATNKLVEKASGLLCALIDADDLMLPDRLEKQVAFHAQHPELAASSCHCYYIDRKGKTMGTQVYTSLQTVDDCRNVLAKDQVVLCAYTGIMIAKSAFLEVGGLDQKFWPCEDMEFVNRLINKGHLITIIQEPLMKYRVHPASAMQSSSWLDTVTKIDYVHYCIHQQRKNEPDITLEQFTDNIRLLSSLEKLNKKRQYYSMQFNREAGFYFYKSNYARFGLYFFVSVVLDPAFVLKNIQKRLQFNRQFRRSTA
ncbi:glycosyltransferase family 2 protein [Telluribacter humicola]|uniref:glycosyltransferase family 2 protein n=1 Tax=Telluribacter humicola TaxID=1720261 RepID=UPI001A9646A2|nr:glycosyltransferase family A protein [Telluribacter humicola]